MAELPGKETQPDPKAVGPTGPVKPPVLEGTARAAKIDSKPKPDKPEPPKAASIPPKPAIKRDADEGGSGSPWLAGLLGGVAGLGAAYGLAYLGMWPSPAQAPAPADPRLAQFATTIPELQTVTSTVQDELSTLNGRVSGLETAVAERPAEAAAAPAAPGEDFSDDIAALNARIEELAAAPTPAADTGALEALRAQVERLSQQLAENEGRINQTAADLATLSETATASAQSDSGAVRLPLIFSGLESAFASGRSFEPELAALQTAAPDAAIPQAIADKAATGLPRPDNVARQLNAALPDMLAGRPVAADAGWQDATADWFRGVVAMRPAGDVEGEGPDAIVARLEAAVERRDFVGANAEFSALPDTMQSAAGTLGDDIAALAAATTLLTQLRSDALGAEAGS